MGNSQPPSGSGGRTGRAGRTAVAAPKGKKLLAQKLSMAAKTGVLNLQEQNIKFLAEPALLALESLKVASCVSAFALC
jgi:hypothetical protein